ncbi:helix-turn-helix domain-containing protein [Streptomyces halobius]|uniref:Helix-turn-helix domain-containing protein n=1 Tax=Streptomyces halobius TaxID=2879846 RepID=A0ABY4MHD8_9ACTN|nr:helix-turn-helix domain-containing protein [Streptomyces halobius]UQA97122.1 helix-turn-helix domain-containing protein [Streptomyces halobius]
MVLRARPGRDDDELAVIRRLARARKAPRDLVMRARMVDLSWAGLRVPTIADEVGCGQKTVRRRLHRFNRCGLEGLEDLGDQGRKRRITETERTRWPRSAWTMCWWSGRRGAGGTGRPRACLPGRGRPPERRLTTPSCGIPCR